MDKVQYLETQNNFFYKKVIRIGLPITLAQLLTSLLAFIDTVMVSGLGDNAVGAVGIGASFFFLMFMINFGLVSGLSIFFAQYWGSKDIKSIHKVFIVTLISSFGITFLFFIFGHFFSESIINIYSNSNDPVNGPILLEYGSSYLKIAAFSYLFHSFTFIVSMLMRSVEKVIFPQIVAAIMVALNTFLNYLLINGNYGFPNMGIEGAAVATVISSIVGAIIFVFFMIYTKREVFKIKFSLINEISREFVNKLFKKALPVTLNELIWGLGMSMYVIAFGFISVSAISSIHIANQIMGLFWVVNAGISNACAIMIGNKLGEGKIEVAKNWGKRFIKLSFFFGVILGTILFFTSAYIPNLFANISPEIKENVHLILIVFSFYVPIKFVNVIHIIGTLRAGGDTLFSFLVEMFALWGIGVPLAFILTIYTSLPLYVIIGIINIEEIVKFVLVNKRFFTYKWAKNLVAN
jgi:putative MATE family efflux protein